MADRPFAGKRIKIRLAEYLSDQAHFGVDVEGLAVGCCDSSTLLAAVL